MMLKHFLITLLLLVSFGNNSIAQMELSLDGSWQIIFDEENIGREEGWTKSSVFNEQENRQNITVPSAWELLNQDYEGVAFYKRVFDVPADWNDKVISLQFGAVNYLSEVWLNDEVVGFNEGGFTPFEFRVDEMIKVGEENVITIRVVGPIILTDQKIDGIGKMETAQWRGGITGGIWQPVKLVATGDLFIEDVYIIPNIHDGTATFQVTVEDASIKNTNAEVSLSISEVGSQDPPVASIVEPWHVHPGVNTNEWKINIPDFKYWSPDDPQLYRAKISVKSGDTVSDTWSERFGMRELTIKDKAFLLNGKPIYIKAAFFEGVYPNGIAYPDNEEMIRQEIRMAKDAGFNMIRPWRRPPAPIWLDIADEMGVLVVGSPALECMTLPLSTPYLPKRVEHEIRQAVLRDRNHACVVQWELFNELHRPVLNQLMRPMANLTRRLDPTRLILDESGGWAFGANMYLPYKYEPTKFNDIHNYPGPFIEEDRYDGYLSIGMTEDEKKQHQYKAVTPGRNVVPGLMSFVSELGYGSLPDLTENIARFKKDGNELTPAYRYHIRLDTEQRALLRESGFSELYPTMKQFYLAQQNIHGAANKRMIEAVRANPNVSGYCIHALSAGDWIFGAGLIDLWRNPKTYAYEGTKAGNQPQIMSIRVKSRNIYAGEPTSLEVIGINDLPSENAILIVEISNKTNGKKVYQKEQNVAYKNRVSQLLLDQFDTQGLNGTYEVTASLRRLDGKTISSNSYEFEVFAKKNLEIKTTQIAVNNMSGPLVNHLVKHGLSPIEFNGTLDKSIPLFVTGSNFEGIAQFVKSGGTAIFIEGVHKKMKQDENPYPFFANVHPSKGLWTCIPHLVHDHPFFEGLPVNGMMRNVYENIWPNRTLRSLKVEGNPNINTIVASIGFDWFSREHKLQYSGPGASWWGSEVAEVSLGKGKMIISQLRLLKNLGVDPAADLIFSNMIQYVSKH